MFRRTIAALLIGSLALVFTGCGGGDTGKQPKLQGPEDPKLKPTTPAQPGGGTGKANQKPTGV